MINLATRLRSIRMRDSDRPSDAAENEFCNRNWKFIVRQFVEPHPDVESLEIYQLMRGGFMGGITAAWFGSTPQVQSVSSVFADCIAE